MVHAVHHVSGRLRIRNPAIKRSASAAARYCDVVRCLPGVRGAKASAVTGSVLIVYDTRITGHQELLTLLGAKPMRAVLANKVAEKIGQALVERMIEHSARALIAALI
jgi:hypothetical protein